MNTRFGNPKLKEKMSNRLCERVCGHRGRFRTRAGSSPCVSQASQRQSWAFVSSGGILGRRSTRTEAGCFFDLGMPSTSCIFDGFHTGQFSHVQKQVPYFSGFQVPYFSAFP